MVRDQQPQAMRSLQQSTRIASITAANAIEQRIHDATKEYYAALRASQAAWHDAQHDFWPFIGYLAEIPAGAYDDFERRIAATSNQTGTKQEQAQQFTPRSSRLCEVLRLLRARCIAASRAGSRLGILVCGQRQRRASASSSVDQWSALLAPRHSTFGTQTVNFGPVTAQPVIRIAS